MEKFKKNKKILLIGGMSLILVSGITFCIHSKKIYKPKEISRELIAMFVQNENGEYNANTSKEFPKDGYVLNIEKSTCKNRGILSQDPATKKISMRASHADQCTLYFDKDVPKIELGDVTIKIQDGTPNFANPATTDETANGLFAMEDDYGTSYYYRGTAPNNYVKFGQNAEGQDMWWRIIRFNGNGTVRIIYDGVGTAETNTYTRGFALENQAWNSNNDDAKYVGWMFGGANGSVSTSKEEAQRNETDSEIKIKVDEWYKANIVDTGYSDYVADSIFCNDRSTPGKNATGLTNDTGLGYGKNVTGYGAYARVGYPKENPNYQNPQPQYTCLQNNDKFTVEEESGGNGALTYPVGLITLDEAIAAGSGKYIYMAEGNQSYYLHKFNSLYFLFSPNTFSSGYASVYFISTKLSSYNVKNWASVAPVINLKAEYLSQLRGTGTATNPFQLS